MEQIMRKFKLLAKAVLGRSVLAKPDVSCKHKRFGSDYGGWNVAIACLGPQSTVYSFGIGKDVSFDKCLIDKYSLVVHGFDPTPDSVDWVKIQSLPEKFVFHECGLAAFDGEALFNPPKNPGYVSHTVVARPSCNQEQALLLPVKRLSTIMRDLGHDRIDVLKMDIEGAEYDVIKDMASLDICPGQILVEFHHRFPEVGVAKTHEAIKSIRAMGYRLVAVSKSGEEFSYLKWPTSGPV